MKRITINKKKSHILLITLLATTLMLAGCGNQNSEAVVNESSSDNVVETTVTPTDESEPAPTEAPMSESEKAIIELSADEYYVDYPISLEDGKKVYIERVPSFEFYPDSADGGERTNLDKYNEENMLSTTLAMHADKSAGETRAVIVYNMDNDYSFINWCINGDTSGFTYNVSEPENWNNGITAYRVDSDYGYDYILTDYVLYSQLDDDSVIKVYIQGFLGSYYSDGEQLLEEHEAILNFYRTAENPFVVVDPATTDVVIK